MKHALIAVIMAIFIGSCANTSEYKNTINEIPEPQPLPDSVEIHSEATKNGDTLDRSDSVNTTFITIGLGRGYGWYEVLFFKDSMQSDTLRMKCDDPTFYNTYSLRYTVNGSFRLDNPCFGGVTTVYWLVWYRERNIKSKIRSFFIE